MYNTLISQICDIQLNPEPTNKFDIKLSICHWNLNGIAAHNYAKLFLLKAYTTVCKFHVVCISRTYFDSSIASDGGNLEISGYNLIRSDYSSNSKCGGVCIFYKSVLPLKIRNIHFLQESISFEFKTGDKHCNFIYLYRSPSQKQNKFEKFSENLERNLVNSFLIVVIGGFMLNEANGISMTSSAQKVMQLIL